MSAPIEFEPAVPYNKLRDSHTASVADVAPPPEAISFGLPGYLHRFRSEHVAPHRAGTNLTGALPLPTNL